MVNPRSNQGSGSLNELLHLIRDLEENLSVSLPQYTKKSIISSRVFIQKECFLSPVIKDTLSVTMNLYAGFILAALNMTRYVDKTRKVRDFIETVATESLSAQSIGDIKHNENILKSIFTKKYVPSSLLSDDTQYTVSMENSSSGFLDIPKEISVPSGRIIQTVFNLDGKNTINVDLYLQLNTIPIPAELLAAFISMNFSPDLVKRYLQWTAGEIEFFRDFILGLDLQEDRIRAMKKDKSGLLMELIKTKNESKWDTILSYVGYYKTKKNIANSIMIVEENTLKIACDKYHINFENSEERMKFFNRSFLMMLIALDDNYNTAKFYYHGLPQYSVFDYNVLRKENKNETVNILDIMKSYSAGMAPRF